MEVMIKNGKIISPIIIMNLEFSSHVYGRILFSLLFVIPEFSTFNNYELFVTIDVETSSEIKTNRIVKLDLFIYICKLFIF